MALRFVNRLCSKNSFWNTPLPNDAPLASTSADYSARLYRQTRYFPGASPISGEYNEGATTTINTGRFTFPIYYMPLDHPRVKVTWKQLSGNLPGYGVTNNLQGYWDAVPVPNPALCKPGTNRAASAQGQIGSEGSDESCVIVCGHEAWEFWKFKPDATYGWTAAYGAYIPNIYATIGAFRTWGVRASGNAAFSGIILAEDSASGTINHGLYMAIPNSGEGASTPRYINPCKRGDKLNLGLQGTQAALDADKLPHGARFRLPYNFDVEAWVDIHKNTSGVNATLLRAMIICARDYGFMVSDSARGVIQFSAEDNRTFGTPYSPWATRPTGTGTLGALNALTISKLPWDQFQQLATVDPLTDYGIANYAGSPRLLRYR